MLLIVEYKSQRNKPFRNCLALQKIIQTFPILIHLKWDLNMSERYLFAGQSYMFYPLHLVFSGFDFYGQHTCTNPLSPKILKEEKIHWGFWTFSQLFYKNQCLNTYSIVKRKKVTKKLQDTCGMRKTDRDMKNQFKPSFVKYSTISASFVFCSGYMKFYWFLTMVP